MTASPTKKFLAALSIQHQARTIVLILEITLTASHFIPLEDGTTTGYRRRRLKLPYSLAPIPLDSRFHLVILQASNAHFIAVPLFLTALTDHLDLLLLIFTGPNIDFLKLEGSTSGISPSSFRNPPHFMSLLSDMSPYGIGEQTIRDAHYETAAVLDHYFYQDNVAPFICIRLMQRYVESINHPRCS